MFSNCCPLTEEYQVLEVKKKCEDFLLTKPGSVELLVTAQAYDLQTLLKKCIDHVRKCSFAEIQKDPYFDQLEPQNLIGILQARVQDLEEWSSINKKIISERDARLFGCINDLVTGYGNFCTDCKTRKVNDGCVQLSANVQGKSQDEMRGGQSTETQSSSVQV